MILFINKIDFDIDLILDFFFKKRKQIFPLTNEEIGFDVKKKKHNEINIFDLHQMKTSMTNKHRGPIKYIKLCFRN